MPENVENWRGGARKLRAEAVGGERCGADDGQPTIAELLEELNADTEL